MGLLLSQHQSCKFESRSAVEAPGDRHGQKGAFDLIRFVADRGIRHMHIHSWLFLRPFQYPSTPLRRLYTAPEINQLPGLLCASLTCIMASVADTFFCEALR